MNLNEDEKKVGIENFYSAVGNKLVRQKFLKEGIAKDLASGKGLGAMYYGYGTVEEPVKIGLIGTGDEAGVLIGAINRAYVQVVAIADIRPYSIYRAFYGDAKNMKARPGLLNKYGWQAEYEDVQKLIDKKAKEINLVDKKKNTVTIRCYSDLYDELLDDPEVEAVVIALPLHLHRDAAIKALKKGKHVLSEKLMAHNVAECKDMARTAKTSSKQLDKTLYLVIGHQRHYNVLYDNAVHLIQSGVLGKIHHIRAQWNKQKDTWKENRPLPDKEMAKELERLKDSTKGQIEKHTKEIAKHQKELAAKKADKKREAKMKTRIAKLKAAIEKLEKPIRPLEIRLKDKDPKLLNAESYGYKTETLGDGKQRSALEELIRWRLWNRTGGGLMAELGSHQLDAASIFISALRDDGKKVHPLSVQGVGGRHVFGLKELDRDIDDHVYCIFEFPAPEYDPKTKPEKKIVVTYSAVTGNGYGAYGEEVIGTEGTLVLPKEQEALLFKGSSTTEITKVIKDPKNKKEKRRETDGSGKQVIQVKLDKTKSTGREAVIGKMALKNPISRGYTEEIEHWAWCIRNPDSDVPPRCSAETALADAVIALVSNMAIQEKRRIVFKPEWFDPNSDETPDGKEPEISAPKGKKKPESEKKTEEGEKPDSGDQPEKKETLEDKKPEADKNPDSKTKTPAVEKTQKKKTEKTAAK